MNPYLDSQKNPHVKIKVLLTSWTTIDCLIDTGFSGGLALPDKLKIGLSTKPVMFQRYELADGSLTTFPLFVLNVKFNNKIKEVTAFFTKSNEALVGIEFLMGFKFVLDLKKMIVELKQ